MVLENSSSPTSDEVFTDEPSFHSDLRDGSGSDQSALRYYIDIAKLPKLFPIIGPLFGYDKKFQQEIQFKLMFTSKELGRPLNQNEVDAFAFWLAKRQAIASWGHPIGIAGGAWRAYNTIEEFRFPFWKTNRASFNINTFGPLKGPPAVILWHSLRVFAYGLTGDFVGRILFGSYAVSSAAVGAASDPRLKECMNSIREKVNSISQKSGNSQNIKTNSGRAMWKQNSSTVNDESSSSTRGVFSADLGGGSRNTSSRFNQQGEILDDPIMSNSGRLDPQSADNELFDDYYKRSLSEQQDFANDTNSDTSQLSTWERIRNGKQVPSLNTQKNSRSTRKYKIDDSNPDNFSYSEIEENTLAKDQAQKKFDEQLERERNGPFSV